MANEVFNERKEDLKILSESNLVHLRSLVSNRASLFEKELETFVKKEGQYYYQIIHLVKYYVTIEAKIDSM